MSEQYDLDKGFTKQHLHPRKQHNLVFTKFQGLPHAGNDAVYLVFKKKNRLKSKKELCGSEEKKRINED